MNTPGVLRVFATACAVGLITLTLTLGSLRHPAAAVSSLPQPPPSHTAVPPAVAAPPALASPRHPRRETRARLAARPHKVVAKNEAVRVATPVHLEAATRAEPAQTPPVEPKRASTYPGKRPSLRRPSPRPRRPPVTTPPSTPVPTPPTPRVTPPPPTASPVENPPAPIPSANTVPIAAPPLVAQTPVPETRPGNGWGDQNHVHTGPPGH